ncbi:hypothetical protein PY254_12490 [Rhodanobacter sp. AS-Z3]|uniref:hypothetical protein n=1 Tax=Rhodanobacter sp. AS-Z3 TaxID=3031330 RepID=UPI002479278C|nr:hypothetical protein [Rhodanobacter sp. AS-Z3]WEN14053.1 hypothetical protein PY254_12490 [Rhodanobacter sp. AS-Z3]
MRRIPACLALGVLLAGGASLSGCIVAAPRHVARVSVVEPVHARIWVPGYWGPSRIWVGGYWRYR